ncbi:hypothetical protein GSY71_15945 [Pusillimonas sp. TS35]|nr:hypothetical protein [Paracandidimonas lactea]MYN14632.1 hypothetical protein [Pusillimonas sp. TS35]
MLTGANAPALLVLSDPEKQRLIAGARLENLGKGSSGAVMVNLEIMAGVV